MELLDILKEVLLPSQSSEVVPQSNNILQEYQFNNQHSSHNSKGSESNTNNGVITGAIVEGPKCEHCGKVDVERATVIPIKSE